MAFRFRETSRVRWLRDRNVSLIGYARVSTDDQTTRMQLDALGVAGCVRVFGEQTLGALRSLTEQVDTGTSAGKMLYAVLGAAT